jgi:predicted nucleic acid-binding protein
MIVLDTNVVSEAMKPEPQPGVQAWLDRQNAESLYLTSITLAELLFGIRALPTGRRKWTRDETLNGLLELFGERVLPFDIEAARHFALLAVTARAVGKGFPTPDGYIAAIAASRGFIVATRDVSSFQAAGLKVINPWDAPA